MSIWVLSIPNPYRGLRGLPTTAWIVFATTLVNRAGMMALPFLVLYLTKELHVAAPLAGLALSAYGIGGLVTAPLAGRLADRIGPLSVMRASLALTGVVLLVIPLVRGFPLVILLTFLWAIAADAARPASMAALAGSTPPEQRRAAIALNRLAINVGMSIGPAVGGFLALVSFPMLFLVDGLTSLTAAGLLSAMLYLQRRRGEAVNDLAPSREAGEPRAFAGHASVWRDHRALAFFVTAFLAHFVYAQDTSAMALYLVRDLQYRESFYGSLFLLNTLIIIAIEVPLNLAMSHWPAWRANALAVMLIGAGFGALAVAQAPVPIAITVVIWTFGEMIFYPTATAYMAELAPPGRTGEYMGALSAMFALAFIVGPWLGTTLLDRYGSGVTWGAMFACGVVGAAWLVLTRRG